MENLTVLFNTLFTELSTLQKTSLTLSRIQLVFGLITTIITTPYQHDPRIEYNDDTDEVLSMRKIIVFIKICLLTKEWI